MRPPDPEAMHEPRVPVHVITGALGSGKTTLLARLLKRDPLPRTAIIVNEFSDVPIDHLLVEGGRDDQLITVAGGCLCCQSSGGFASALYRLMRARAQTGSPRFDRVVVETSGLTPGDEVIRGLLDDPGLAAAFVPGLIVSCFDALGADRPDRIDDSISRGIALADRVVITKGDLSLPGQFDIALAAARSINPCADIVDARMVDDEIDRVLSDPGTVLQQRRTFEAHGHWRESHRKSLGDITTFVIERDQPIAEEAVSEWLTALTVLAPESLLRIKGLVAVKDMNRHIVVQVVGSVVHPAIAAPPGDVPPHKTLLVFIVRGLDGGVVEAMLDYAVSRQSLRPPQTLPSIGHLARAADEERL